MRVRNVGIRTQNTSNADLQPWSFEFDAVACKARAHISHDLRPSGGKKSKTRSRKRTDLKDLKNKKRKDAQFQIDETINAIATVQRARNTLQSA